MENFGHEHPLILLNEQSNQSVEEEACCVRCGEKVLPSALCFRCTECSGFYLHKLCADAPLEINHPFHPTHPLVLLPSSPYGSKGWKCNFCDQKGDRFVYHCSCKLDFHIKCALFTYNIAQNNFKELEHVAYEDASTKNDGEQLENLGDCFGCWDPLANSVYFSPDCGFNLHKKCAELPLEINHKCHRRHPLFLQFIMLEPLPCKVCHVTVERRGFVYCCLPCKFVLHIQCVSPSPPPIIEDKSHPHPFTLLSRRTPFICDACGTEGNGFAYLCCTCEIMVHERCISLPRIIKSRLHEHCISHTYFIEEENFKSWDCIICLEEINMEAGAYYCLYCKIVAHVNCATKDKDWFYVVEKENEDEMSSSGSLELSPITVIESNDAGEATRINHFKHEHNLMLGSIEMVEYVGKCCDGCILPISPPYFRCSEASCVFFLHKGCAELLKKKQVWLHGCQEQLLTLISDSVSHCEICRYYSNGFLYKCNKCKRHICLKCVIALSERPLNHPGHPHPISYYLQYRGQCHGCGRKFRNAHYCKDCNLALCSKCLTLPITVQHKCDEKHLLALTYGDDNDYSATHYCDICEETRDPSCWFYHCATCNTSAHVKCVLRDYPFIKLGSIFHGLTFVRKIYYYPKCFRCDKPCLDLALECSQPGCSYIIHFTCFRWSQWHVHSQQEED
ncbi:Zinc finger, PHD-type [Corchorus olitorius]|uniref:Zinc finger, PHD-type n=1 Tax=Corchorus olitorius TaxID=93759 RepID=A0A1R3KMG3_9ROSI|nr:Zinc finger, PHD-type [Corchorus olitorius]